MRPGSDTLPPAGDPEAGVDADANDPNRIVQVSAGTGSACALTRGGSAWCWGSNEYAQLGVLPMASQSFCPFSIEDRVTPSVPCNPVPKQVPGLHDAVQISMGNTAACAVDREGAVWCWGNNFYGELGHPKSLDPMCQTTSKAPCNPTPTRIPGIVAKSVSVFYIIACAVTTSDELACWGSNEDGALVTGPLTNTQSPPTLIPGFTGVAKVSAGNPTCALKLDGSVWCWGNGGSGLGHASGTHGDVDSDAGLVGLTPNPVYMSDNVTPAFGPGSPGDLQATDLSIGSDNACAVAGGRVWCWGDESAGVAGAAYAEHFYPIALDDSASGDAGVSSVSIAITHGCRLDTNGMAACWGESPWGECGTGRLVVDSPDGKCSNDIGCLRTPTALAEPGPWAQVVAAFGQSVGLQRDGTVWAWGINDTARLGHAPWTGGDLPCQVPGLSQSFACDPTPRPVTGL
jgi:alpha-tubulin suppressor-like RCC1 family protein